MALIPENCWNRKSEQATSTSLPLLPESMSLQLTALSAGFAGCRCGHRRLALLEKPQASTSWKKEMEEKTWSTKTVKGLQRQEPPHVHQCPIQASQAATPAGAAAAGVASTSISIFATVVVPYSSCE